MYSFATLWTRYIELPSLVLRIALGNRHQVGHISFSLSLFLSFSLSLFLSFSLSLFQPSQSNSEFLVETDHGRKSVAERVDDSDAAPISESEVLEGSVASAVASGSAAPEFIRLPECETTAANESVGYWQRQGKCSARRRIRQYYMIGTTTWKRNTITDERALARFFDPQVIFQVQTKLHIHRSWRIPAKTSKTEPMEQTQATELSITSWNPDTLNHGKLERFLTYFDADIIIFQGTRLGMRTTPRDGKAKDDTITPVRSEWCSRGYQIFSWRWNNGEFSNHACGVLVAIREATVGAGQIVQRYDPPRSMAGRFGGIRVRKLASTRRPQHFGRVCTTGQWTLAAQGALLGSRYKDNGKASKAHIHYFWRRLQRGPPRRSGGIAHPRPSRTTVRTSARCARQRSSGARRLGLRDRCHRTLAGKETLGEDTMGNKAGLITFLLSVDLASPPVTVDFLSSRNMRRNALAPIDHAPLRITLRYRFRAVGRRGGRRRFDRARLAAATTGVHFAKQFIDEVQRRTQAKKKQIDAVGPGSTSGPKLAIHGKLYFRVGNDGFPSR